MKLIPSFRKSKSVSSDIQSVPADPKPAPDKFKKGFSISGITSRIQVESIIRILIISFVVMAFVMTAVAYILNSKAISLKEQNVRLNDTNNANARQISELSNLKTQLVQTITSISGIFSSPVKYTESSFGKPGPAKQNCSDLQAYLKKLDARNRKVVDSINEVSEILQKDIKDSSRTEQAKLEPVDVTFNDTFFSTVANDIVALQDNLKKTESQVVEKDKKIGDLQNKVNAAYADLEDMNAKLQVMQNETNNLRMQKDAVKQELDKKINEEKNKKVTVSSGNQPQQPQEIPIEKRQVFPEFYPRLKGVVADYNEKWGFIIINIGKNTKMKMNINGTERDVIIPIPLDKELFIANGSSFVAKGRVVKTYDDYSVANVIYPSAQKIEAGNTVFFPEQPDAAKGAPIQ